jgi:membrane fusion protein, multidrug efflux system
MIEEIGVRTPAPEKPRHRLRMLFFATAGLLAVAATGKALVKSTAKSAPRPETVPVATALATRLTVPLQVKAIGNVEAYATVSVRALVSGQLMKIHFQQGQEVKKDDLLFRIDPRPLQAALDQAEGTLAKDRAQLENAKAVAARYQKLLQDGIASKELYDQYRTAADSQAATVQADEAGVENARVQLSYATIRAPLSGLTGNLGVYEGNLVKANDTTPLVTITQASPVYVTFSVPEGELARINRARAEGPVAVNAAAPSDESHPLTGELTFVDNSVDTTTGTIRLKATFANRERSLWPGQFVKVTVTTGEQTGATVVPAQAVQVGQNGPYVYVVKEDLTAEARPVKLGPGGEGVSVVTQGVAPGERVVTDGQLRLSPGAKVELKAEGTGDKPGELPGRKPGEALPEKQGGKKG